MEKNFLSLSLSLKHEKIFLPPSKSPSRDSTFHPVPLLYVLLSSFFVKKKNEAAAAFTKEAVLKGPFERRFRSARVQL